MSTSISNMEPASFQQELNMTLALEVDGKKGEVFGGHIEEVNIQFHSYGFEGAIRFATFNENTTHELFAQEKEMKVTVTFKSTDLLKLGSTLLELKGTVYRRASISVGQQSLKETVRRYEIYFSDAAKMTWDRHFPFKIFVDQTMKDVIDEEKNPAISIKYDFEALNQPSPIIALPVNSNVSFYSFLMWYLHKTNGVFEYSYKENSYSILGKKTEGGKPAVILEKTITPALCKYSEPLRYQERTIKHSPENSDNIDQDNPNSFPVVRKDSFDDSNYHLFPEQVPQKISSKLGPEKPVIEFFIKEFSTSFDFEKMMPGGFIEIKGDEKRGAQWCDESLFKGKVFRLSDVSFKAIQIHESEAVKKPYQLYQLEVYVSAESKEETYVSRPPFSTPSYPFSIQGTIFSEIGDKEQTTFNVVKNDKNPLGYYLVKVPLAGPDKKVVVPFTPDFTSGQFYFPLCKDQQVMLSVYFQTAKIERVLDWQPLARLPLETQANQIVFASNGKDKYAVQQHEFKNGSDSVLTIKQSSSPDQTQTVQIQEKDIVITVSEKGKNTVTIQLNRESGLTLQVKDEASGVTQQSIYNPTSITHTSEGKGGKSMIEQKPDSIAIKCKKLKIDCEEGTIDATKTFTQNAKSKIFVKAPVVNVLDTIKMGG